MVVTLRKTLLLIILALLLLTLLIGQSLRSSPVPVQRHSHSLAYICPPPPYDCMG
jgi:hypothetical protein